MFNMLLLNSVRISYAERESNVHGANVVGIAMWFYGVVLPFCWYTAFKGVELFWFKLPYWAWIILTVHIVLEQLNVVAMFRLRSLAAGKDGVPFYKNIGKNDKDAFTVIFYLLATVSFHTVIATMVMEAPCPLFWPLLFLSMSLFTQVFYHISYYKTRYYNDRKKLIDICRERKFACDKKD